MTNSYFHQSRRPRGTSSADPFSWELYEKTISNYSTTVAQHPWPVVFLRGILNRLKFVPLTHICGLFRTAREPWVLRGVLERDLKDAVSFRIVC
jgi:hypothetical protein